MQLSFNFPLVPLAVFFFLGLVVLAVVFGAIQAGKRREAMLNLARRLNLAFNPGLDYAIPGRFSFLKPLSQGDNRYATNLLSGTYQQHEILVFDYHYETHSTDSKGNRTTQHHWFSCFLLTLPVVFPELTIRREGFFIKLAELFGYGDINFESAEFSRAFNVRSPDKKFAYDVCNARMIDYLLANRDLSIELENNVLALAFDSRLAVEQIENNLQRLIAIRARLPDYLFTPAT